MDEKLFEQLRQLGMPMLQPEPELDVHQVLADVVKSQQMRLWEAFPALLSKAAQLGNLDFQKAGALFTRPDDLKHWQNLLLLAMALYSRMKLTFAWMNSAKAYLEASGVDVEARLRDYAHKLESKKPFHVGNGVFTLQRLEQMMEHYFTLEKASSQDSGEKVRAFALEHALSQLFSPKQKELFWKKVNQKPLTKTEREYYSRSVKKKVQALANDQLHQLARRLVEGK